MAKEKASKVKSSAKKIDRARNFLSQICVGKECFGISEDLRKRILTSIILIPIIIIILYSSKFLFSALILSLVIISAFEWNELVGKDKRKNSWLLAGLGYIGIPFLLLIALREVKGGPDIILWMLFITWATDTSAYFVGKNIGGPKLAPKISPNKTWSGLIGGVFASMIVGATSALVFNGSVRFFIIFGGLLAVVEQAGDLFESKIKRRFGVKDSGDIIPGHGGLLDRIDGFLFVVPFVTLIVLFVGNKVF